MFFYTGPAWEESLFWQVQEPVFLGKPLGSRCFLYTLVCVCFYAYFCDIFNCCLLYIFYIFIHFYIFMLHCIVVLFRTSWRGELLLTRNCLYFELQLFFFLPSVLKFLIAVFVSMCLPDKCSIYLHENRLVDKSFKCLSRW